MATATAATTNGSKTSKFVPGFEPEQIALASKGTPVHSQFNGDEMAFWLTDGRRWYAPIYVGQKIEQMRLQPGEFFEVCKTETRRGNQRIVEVQISAVVSPEGPASAPQHAPAGAPLQQSHQSNGSTAYHPLPDLPPASPLVPMNGNGETSKDHLARCYRDAIDVCLATLVYAKAKGLVLAPDFGDVRALAATICINETGRR